ncbi:MAG: hypothetical protein RIS70_4178, partial [Planctomycetota bacterium]
MNRLRIYIPDDGIGSGKGRIRFNKDVIAEIKGRRVECNRSLVAGNFSHRIQPDAPADFRNVL